MNRLLSKRSLRSLWLLILLCNTVESRHLKKTASIKSLTKAPKKQVSGKIGNVVDKSPKKKSDKSPATPGKQQEEPQADSPVKKGSDKSPKKKSDKSPKKKSDKSPATPGKQQEEPQADSPVKKGSDKSPKKKSDKSPKKGSVKSPATPGKQQEEPQADSPVKKGSDKSPKKKSDKSPKKAKKGSVKSPATSGKQQEEPLADKSPKKAKKGSVKSPKKAKKGSQSDSANKNDSNPTLPLKGKTPKAPKTTKAPETNGNKSPTTPTGNTPTGTGSNTDGGSSENPSSFAIPKFLLTMDLEPIRLRRRQLANAELEYKDELIDIISQHLISTSNDDITLTLKSDAIVESPNSVINAMFSGDATTASDGVPTEDEVKEWILNSFNEVSQREILISAFDDAGHETLTKIDDVKASIVSNTDGYAPQADVVTLTAKSNAGLISGMVVGIFVLSLTFGFVYKQHKKQPASRYGYKMSDYYDDDDYAQETETCEDTNASDWTYSPTKKLSYFAAASAQNDIREYTKSSRRSKKKTSMSKLAAGATQEEFSQNGMETDPYGENQNKTNSELDPIVEVNSTSDTDDKAIIGDLNVPKLLPELSVSSCPSDDSNIPKSHYSPVNAPALSTLSRDDTLMDDFDGSFISSKANARSNSSGGSPVRKLSFAATDSEPFSDKSSDSGVQELLACENRKVLSEEEAVAANLIAFVDDGSDNDNMHEKDDDIVCQALGFTEKPVEENLPQPSDEYNATILVLSSENENKGDDE